MSRVLAVWLALVSGAVAAPSDEIEALLAYVGKLEGASLIRNGDAHPAAAVAHLRRKWTAQKEQIQSAEDFIRLCATGSSVSGLASTIRFADGHEEEAAVVLQRQLKAIRGAPAARSGAAVEGSPQPAPSGRIADRNTGSKMTARI